MKRISLILLLVLGIIIFFSSDLDQWLSFSTLKQHRETFQTMLAAAPWRVTLVFFTAYVVVTALSLPGAAIMTLAAGALFGIIHGTLLVSFASTIGATLAFLVSRYLFRAALQRRYGDKLRTVNDGIARDGAFYLFTLRLVPVFPFFLINLVMGLTPLRVTTFYWVSQVGMLPGTLVYINAGTQLGQLDSAAGILSPGLILSFTLLGLFPLLARRLTRRLQRRRVYARWQKPKHFDRNLIVIGGGAAGLVNAYIAATVRARVTLVEAGRMGGDCLNTGCVPSKALIRVARLAGRFADAGRFGFDGKPPRVNFKKLMARVNDVIARIEPHDSVERYTGLGVDVLQGYARLIDPWTVEVTTEDGQRQRLTTRSIVIATGARPFVPPIPGLDKVDCLTSETLWDTFAGLDAAPSRLVVLGGGPIGCELSQALSQLGCGVTQIERGPRLLPREDLEVSALLRAIMEEDYVRVLTEHEVLRCERDVDDQYIVVRNNEGELRIAFDYLICATGRAARLEGYGLEELGIETGRTIRTNDYLETLYPNIYAAGDVAGPYQFTHTAAHQAWYTAVNALFGDLKRFKADYRVIPWTTFTDPEIARVGLNEAEAEAGNIPHDVTRYKLSELDRAITDGDTRGFIKILTVPGKDRILGVTIVGEHAGELLAEYVLAMKHGLGLNGILGTIHTYPTLAEANKYAAGEWKRAHAPQWLLPWLERYHAWRRR
jgi:pyruvate/2-oxoglutarate dehydrogenase complex dihydrolipoamide dehydrogenase (E3) component/uncharacterized membrane protein YdjX (TVP38/TMEM64 family)